jgi:Tfp pilus assembly protein PilO
VQVKTKNLAVIALAAVLVLTLWYRMMYSPLQSKASSANQAAEEAESRVNTLDRQIRQAKGQASDEKSKKAALDELSNAIPVTPQLAKFLRTTDSVRAASGVGFQSITPQAPTLVNGVETTNVGIIVEGEYGQVIDYINRLNEADRLVVIDSIGFSTAGAASAGAAGGGPVGEVFAGVGAAPNLQVQLTARLFSQASASAAPASTGSSGSAPASGSSGSSGGSSSGTQQGGPTAPPPGVNNN